jgi:hypothetical protein
VKKPLTIAALIATTFNDQAGFGIEYDNFDWFVGSVWTEVDV